MNKKVSPKTFSRYIAIQALYNSNYQSDYETIKDYFLDASEFKLQFDFKIELRKYKMNKNFLKTLLITFNQEKNKVDRLIESNLQNDWNLKRLPTVLLSILRVAVTEMIVSKNTSIGIIWTANNYPGSANELKIVGFDVFLPKPITKENKAAYGRIRNLIS